MKHRHEAEQLRRYPPTKVLDIYIYISTLYLHYIYISTYLHIYIISKQVLVPAGLHSESCSSLFSAWDIDTEAADGGED